MNLFTPEKFVFGTLVGVDGNAFSLCGHFRTLAKQAKWSKEEIDRVLNEARSGSYENLTSTLMAHMSQDPVVVARSDKTVQEITSELDEANDDKLEALFDALVPSNDEAETFHGELVSAFSYLKHEFFNNGNVFFTDENRTSQAGTFLSNYTTKEIKGLFDSLAKRPTDDKEVYGRFIATVKHKLIEFIETTENKPNTISWRSVEGEWDLQKCDDCERFFMPMDMRNNCTCVNCYDEESA